MASFTSTEPIVLRVAEGDRGVNAFRTFGPDATGDEGEDRAFRDGLGGVDALLPYRDPVDVGRSGGNVRPFSAYERWSRLGERYAAGSAGRRGGLSPLPSAAPEDRNRGWGRGRSRVRARNRGRNRGRGRDRAHGPRQMLAKAVFSMVRL
ncbi:hypothetical protein ACFQ9H_17585 [Streptomyces sp. NPDC056517]|uniref:hypothetical protein n=1 Tax=Streptomyces sp. NPDC056517 TaxID=3345848 RepID=UPI0036B66CEA